VASQLVVIADDSGTDLKILRKLMLSIGGQVAVQSFSDPGAALAFCSGHHPDLVLLPAVGAHGEAADIIKRLRAQAACANIPVILIGSDQDLDCVERGREAGADDHMLVPIDQREFGIRVRSQLRARRGGASPAETAREQAQAERSGQAYEMLLRRMFCVTGRDGRYLLVNRLFAAFLGMPASALIGKRPSDAHGGSLARIVMDSDERLLSGRAVQNSSEEEIVDRHGNPCVLLVSKALFHAEDGHEAMVVTLFVDITDRKRTEREMIAAREQAELANRTKTEFVANMSHELRTPLNAIIGFSQVIAGEMLGPIGTSKYIGYARDVVASAEHLLGIINDILDVSKLEAGKLELAVERVDPGSTVADVIRLAEAKALPNNISIGLRREGEIPPLRADGRKLKQIVLNLLVNAIKFSNPGGRVEIVLRNLGGAVAIAVVDHGIGMDAAEVRLAMTRFGQVASTWSRRHDGTGLGLPLAIGLTELHGGTLTIHSIKGVGTTATVTFPRERSQSPPQPSEGSLRAVAQS
jgi:PAS domain S-box-containing protein